MKDLIGRLEKATGPERGLDCAIYLALGATAPEGHSQYWTAPDQSSRHYESLIPRYTASIDAAMKLMPELIWLTIETGTQANGARSGAWPVVACGSNKTGEAIWKGQAINLPITLCIAAFKARLLTAGQRGDP